MHRSPLPAIRGRNDPFVLPAGAEAYRRDIPGAEVRLLDTGHFALETHALEIATANRRFLEKVLKKPASSDSGHDFWLGGHNGGPS